MRSHIRTAALAFLAMGFGSIAAEASPIYNAVQDFSLSGNPNGAWAYGEGVGGVSFTLLPNAFTGGFTGNPAFQYWQSATPTSNVPLVGKNTGSTTIDVGTLIAPPDVLLIHPGVSDDVIVQWTAPYIGTFSYSGLFELLDVRPTGVLGEVFDNGALLYSGALTGPGANQSNNTPGQSENFSGTVALNAGDKLSFVVNRALNYSNDSTGFNASVTQVPEPLTLSVFGAGLVGIGAVRRRKRAKTR